MMTVETYLRRCLLAPIVIPILAFGVLYLRGASASQDGVAVFIASLLGYPFVFGAVPYVWMLWDKRTELDSARGGRCEEIVFNLPQDMFLYFWKSVGMASVIALVVCAATSAAAPSAMLGAAGVVALATATLLLFGSVGVFVAGYLYVGVTLAFLRLFQKVGLVEPTACSQRRGKTGSGTGAVGNTNQKAGNAAPSFGDTQK